MTDFLTAASARASVLGLPTPLARLYGLAMHMGITVHDGDDWDDLEDVGALAAFGKSIILNPAIDDDRLRAEVLAMALLIVTQMTNVPEFDEPGSIYTRNGFVCVTFDRVPEGQATSNGQLATLFARNCGLGTTSAAFCWYVPLLADD